MNRNRMIRTVLGAMTAGMLLVSPGCGRAEGDKEVKEQTQAAKEVENLDKQAQGDAAAMSSKLAQAGVTNLSPDPNTLQLTEEQKSALEARIKVEKDSSYRALLQEVLDKDREIKGLNEQIGQLRASLPAPQIAKADDTHFGMALAFLKHKGVAEEKARELIGKVLVTDQMAPGFAVYHFYSHGVYGTWVAQGKADISPSQLQADVKARTVDQRDAAREEARDLQAKVADLNIQKEKVTSDLEALKAEKAQMTADLRNLTAASEAQQALLNSVHYLVGARKDLVKEGVIVVPVFARDRAGENWTDHAFTRALDLRGEDTILLTASDAGLRKINKVEVVPGSLEKDKHYTLAFNEDRTIATVKFLAKDRFKNEKVVFALAD